MIPADVTKELDPDVAAEVAAADLLAAFDRQVAAAVHEGMDATAKADGEGR